MATVSLAPTFKQQFFDSNGNPLAGGLVYTYQAGTSTLQTTYTDSTGVTANANPVVLDANGEANIWLDVSLSYKFVVKTSTGTTLKTTDGVIGLLTNNSINTASLQDLAVTQPKIALGAVGALQLANSTSVDATRAVTTDHIRAGAVTASKLDGTTTASAKDLLNASLACSVATNALTIALKTKVGADATATTPISIGMRSSTATASDFNIRSVTAALSLIVPSGATLGMASGVSGYLWVYALDNAGAVELAVSYTWFDDGSIQSTTAISAVSTVNSVIYSTVARTNVPVRIIGRIKISEATAGTWVSLPTEVQCSNEINKNLVYCFYNSGTNQQTVTNGGNADLTAYNVKGKDSHNALNATNGVFSAPRDDFYTFSAGAAFGTNATGTRILYFVGPYFTVTADYQLGNASIPVQLSGTITVYLLKGDAFKCQVYQNSGGALATTNDSTANYISIVGSGAPSI